MRQREFLALATGKNKPKRSRASRTRAARLRDWTRLPDEELLDLRICDLKLKIEGTELESRIEKLSRELKSKLIGFRPHCWLSEDWFCPDGLPGFAIPFYLAHPRLKRLEKKQMLEVEGGTREWCLKILRHETGHAVDNAFGLHRKRQWSRVFGKYSQPYPECYQPKPYSKSYVLHLDPFYAQSHPAEDFAETFAIWLKPRSAWRTTYTGWAAIKKLEYVDNLMQGCRNGRARVRSRERVDPVRTIRKTLREHYEEKRARYGLDMPDVYDRELQRLFADPSEHNGRVSAASFVRRHRVEFRRVISRWTGQYQYTIDQLLGDMINRCRELNLRLDRPEDEVVRDAIVMITAQVMHSLHEGHHRFAL